MPIIQSSATQSHKGSAANEDRGSFISSSGSPSMFSRKTASSFRTSMRSLSNDSDSDAGSDAGTPTTTTPTYTSTSASTTPSKGNSNTEKFGNNRRSEVERNLDMTEKIAEIIGEDSDIDPVNYFPPSQYMFNVKNKSHEVVDVMNYTLSLPQKIFLFLELPDCCILGQYFSFLMLITIAISCVSFVMSSIDSFRYTPSSCDKPACENDANLCPNTTICEPVEADYFFIVETCCVIIFTFDYVLRMSTVSFVPPRLSHLLPQRVKHADPAHRKEFPDPEYTWYHKLWKYGTKPFNIIDLVAIAPYYISFGAKVGSSFVILRVLRLIRVFRILKSKNVRTGLKIIQKALMASVPALSILSFLTLLLVLLFGSLIYFFEGGDFTVDESFPEGAYVRWNVNHSEKEESPFSSILLSIYWAVVTATTVGYGDFYPTTNLGRVTAVCLMYLGIIAIALPISIVGSNFDREYQAVHGKDNDEDKPIYNGTKEEKRQQMMSHMQEMSDMMQQINSRMELISEILVEEMEEDKVEDYRLSVMRLSGMRKSSSSGESEEQVTRNKILEMSSK